MTSIRNFITHKLAPMVHRFLAKHNLFVKVVVLLRNQCNCVIAKKISDGVDLRFNGELEVIQNLAIHCRTFADVGGNQGEWTQWMLKHAAPNTTGHVFEPNPSYLNQLKETLSETKVKIYELALSDIKSEMPFILEGQSSRLQENEEANGQIRVMTDTMDNLFPEQTIDFIKIDCEGHDFKVIRGAEGMLKEKRVKFIQFEYNSLWLEQGSSLLQTIGFLKSKGFDTFRIHKKGLAEFDYAFFGDYYRYSNYLAVNQSLKEDMGGLVIKKTSG